jgi:hypothetical protein
MDDDGAISVPAELVTITQRGERPDALMALLRRSSGDLEQYDPQRGVVTIAAAETAERLFRRAKDPARLLEAIAVKLTEQRRFILWWDGEAKRYLRRGYSRIPRAASGMIAGSARMSGIRW